MAKIKFKYGIVLGFVLILLGAQPSIYWFILKNKQQKAYIHTQQLIALKRLKKTYTIRLEKEELFSLRWKNDHEFYKDGFICDIITVKKDKHLFVIDYIHDKKETAIESSLKNIFKNDFSNQKHQQKAKRINVQLVYLQPDFLETVVSYAYLREYSTLWTSNYKSISLDSPSPPPWC